MGTIVKDMPGLDDGPTGTMDYNKPAETPAAAGEPTVEDSSSHSPTNSKTAANPEPKSVATLSNPWEFDANQERCTSCRDEFNPINRRHHCRMCGKIFCNRCSDQRALIPPSSIVLTPDAGKKASPRSQEQQFSFSPDPDPDRYVLYSLLPFVRIIHMTHSAILF